MRGDRSQHAENLTIDVIVCPQTGLRSGKSPRIRHFPIAGLARANHMFVGNQPLVRKSSVWIGTDRVFDLGVSPPRERIHLRFAALCSAASILQSLIESVQPVPKLAESDLFCPQLLLSVNFSRLMLLFFTF